MSARYRLGLFERASPRFYLQSVYGHAKAASPYHRLSLFHYLGHATKHLSNSLMPFIIIMQRQLDMG